MTLMTVACVVGLPWTTYPIQPGRAASSGFEFALPTAGMALAFSTFGITGVGASELFAYPYWCIEKGYARIAGPRAEDEGWARRARGWMRVMQLDAWFSMIVFTLATVAFYLLGAAVLKPAGARPQGRRDDPDPRGDVRRSRWATWTRPVFLIGAWAVLFKTLYVATAANSRLTADFLDLAGHLEAVAARGSRPDGPRLLRLLSRSLALGLYLRLSASRSCWSRSAAMRQGLMLPLIAGATLYLAGATPTGGSTPIFLTDIFAWLAFFAITAVVDLQRPARPA